MLLAFTMQMTLILTLSLVLASTTAFRKAVLALSRIPRNTAQVVALAVLCVAFVSYLNWGLGLALGPMIAIHFCSEAERKGIRVDFLFMLATLAGAGAVWQFGLSASAPLLVATPGHFLQQTTGIMTLGSTIWSPASIILVITFIIARVVAGYIFMPKKIRPSSDIPESYKLGESAKAPDDAPPEKRPVGISFAQRLERSFIVVAA